MSILSTLYQSTIGRAFGKPVNGTNNASGFWSDTSKLLSRKRKRNGSDTENEDVERVNKRRNSQAHASAPGTMNSLIDVRVDSHNDEKKPTNNPDLTMPPPSSIQKANFKRAKLHGHLRDRTSLPGTADTDGASQFSTSTRRRPAMEVNTGEEYNMERARRHAAATTLPVNSGIWERGERELFFHLSYRGFEPVLPREWMQDFPTLPLSLYHVDGAQNPALIQPGRGKGKEFRAIKAFQDLLSIGKDVRDKVFSSPGKEVHGEDVLEKAINRYLSWALADADINTAKKSKSRSKSNLLPIHIVTKVRSSQTTTEGLLSLKRQMHALAAQYRRAKGVELSIERILEPDPDETQELESTDDDLPVIYGVLICRSIVAVLTLNSQVPPPLPRDILDDNGSTASIDDDDGGRSSGGDPRYIADFDLGDPAKDVWNALAIAILAMQVRRDMLVVRETMEGRSRRSSRQASLASEMSDPDK